MDGPAMPSLLGLPYLDPEMRYVDRELYASTRAMVLSPRNPWYFEPAKRGCRHGRPSAGPV